MTIGVLTTNHAFGVKSDVNSGVQFITDNTILYPCGHHAILLNVESKTQRFVPATEQGQNITCLSVSPSRKYFAIAERSEHPIISVHDLLSTRMRRKTLVLSDTISQEVVSMSFSPDGKFLLAQCGGPDYPLFLLQWEKNKCLSTVKLQNSPTIRKVSFSHDGSMVCLTGVSVCRFFRMADYTLKNLPSGMSKRENQDYTCHVWITDERLIIGTDSGELMLIEGGEFKAILSSSPLDGKPIVSITQFSKGFIVGSEAGVVRIFERTDDKDLAFAYKCEKTFTIDTEPHTVQHLIANQSEDLLIVLLANKQIMSLPFNKIDFFEAEQVSAEYVAQSFHAEEITGLATCLNKPFVATCSYDRTVRLWNYIDPNAEMVQTFTEDCHSIAYHPSGLQLLVGFSDKLRLMHVLVDDLRVFKEIPIKKCTEVQFSRGGHMFAAASGNSVQVYDTYTCECIGNLRGHNGKVQSIVWCNQDTQLVTAGNDGAIYEWKLETLRRSGDYVLKGCMYSSVTCPSEGRVLYAVGSDQKLKEIVDSTCKTEVDSDIKLTQCVVSNSGKLLFAGAVDGSVRAYSLPLNGDYVAYPSHSSAVTALSIAYDDSSLFTTGADGSVIMHDIRDHDGKSKRIVKEIPFTNVVLVSKGETEERSQQVAELKQRLEDSLTQFEYQMRLKELNHAEKIRAVKETLTANIEKQENHIQMLETKIQDLENDQKEQSKEMRAKFEQDLAQSHSQAQAKLTTEFERYDQLKQESLEQQELWERQMDDLKKKHEQDLEQTQQEYEDKLEEAQNLRMKVEKEKSDAIALYTEENRQTEEDADAEISHLRTSYEERLSSERDGFVKLKGENAMMRERYSMQLEEMKTMRKDLEDVTSANQELHDAIEAQRKEIYGLEKEVRERNETITDKEKRLYDLKKKNQELEKFKFVLDHKIKELKRQVDPKDVEIAEMKEKIREMDRELENYTKELGLSEIKLKDQKYKTTSVQAELHELQIRTLDLESLLGKIRDEIYTVTENYQDFPKLKDAVRKLYQNHVLDKIVPKSPDRAVQEEYVRQKKFLEKSVSNLKAQLAKDKQNRLEANATVLQTNATLVEEISELRREVQLLKGNKKGKDYGKVQSNTKELKKEISMQKDEIRKLRDRNFELESLVGELENRNSSKRQLEPLDDYQNGEHASGAQTAREPRSKEDWSEKVKTSMKITATPTSPKNALMIKTNNTKKGRKHAFGPKGPVTT